MCKHMEIRHTKTVAYHSRSNGGAEVAWRQMFEKFRQLHIDEPGSIGIIRCALRAHLDQVPLNYPSKTVVQPSSTAHFPYGFPTVEPLSWYSNKLLSGNLATALFQPCKRCHTP